MEPLEVKALIICDQVLCDRATGKWSIISVFDNITVSRFPTLHPSLCVYVRISGGVGAYKIVLDVGRLTPEGFEVVSRIDELTMRITDPTTTGDFGVTMRNVGFPEPDRYAVRLLANGRLLGEWPLTVKARKQEAPQ